jgi:hypothetical protein
MKLNLPILHLLENLQSVLIAGAGGGFDVFADLPLVEDYALLVDHLNIEAVILVDGGVDSLMHGDEQQPGSLIDDTLSVAAASTLDLPVKLLACLGFGAEIEVCHHHALENMATLTREGAFYGACALVQAMEVYQLYESACRYVFEKENHSKSHINNHVMSAVLGKFGYDLIYWF